MAYIIVFVLSIWPHWHRRLLGESYWTININMCIILQVFTYMSQDHQFHVRLVFMCCRALSHQLVIFNANITKVRALHLNHQDMVNNVIHCQSKFFSLLLFSLNV